MAKEKKRFEYKLNLGKHPVSGEVIRRSFYSTKSLRDAKKKADAFQRNYELEMMTTGSSVIRNEKFSTWALSRLETYKRPYVKPNTYAGTYLAPVQQHLIPAFGEMKIGDIKPIHSLVMSPKEDSEKAVAAHTAWHVGMACGDILPDSGIYFAAVKQATISDKLAEDIAKNMEQYAISLVRLYAEEAEDK